MVEKSSRVPVDGIKVVQGKTTLLTIWREKALKQIKEENNAQKIKELKKKLAELEE